MTLDMSKVPWVAIQSRMEVQRRSGEVGSLRAAGQSINLSAPQEDLQIDRGICSRTRRPRNIHNNTRPPPLQKFITPHRIIRPMSIQTTHQQNRRHRLLLTRALRPPHIQRHLRPLIFLRACRMRDLDILNRTLEQRSGFHIGLLLRFVGGGLYGAIDVGEAGDTVDGASAEVDGYGGGFVAAAGFVGLGYEVFGSGEEFFGVFVAVAIVDALFDEGLEDGGEVLVFAVVEGVEGAFAWKFPFLVPGGREKEVGQAGSKDALLECLP